MKILKTLGGVRPYSTAIRTKGGRAYALTSGKEEVGRHFREEVLYG